MAENLLLLVPHDDAGCAARVMAIAESLWDLGLVPQLALDGPWGPYDAEHAERFQRRAKAWSAAGRALNDWAFEQEWDSLSLWCSEVPMLLPYSFQSPTTHLHCPRCDGHIWRTHAHPQPHIDERIRPDDTVHCPHCDAEFLANGLIGRGGTIVWTRFALVLNDVSHPDVPLDSPGIDALCQVLGPSHRIPGWST